MVEVMTSIVRPKGAALAVAQGGALGKRHSFTHASASMRFAAGVSRLLILVALSLVSIASSNALADPPVNIQFSGFEWSVKESGSMGPGPNAWNPKNVWLDAKGQLHLKITSHDGKWECAEVSTTKRFGFGTYEFQISGAIERLDPQVVLGLFNYPTRDVGVDGTNEIDIEYARWGNHKWPNGNFTVWPPVKAVKNGSDTFEFSLKTEETTQRFVWNQKSLEFECSSRGDDKLYEYIHRWKFQPDDYMMRIPQNPEPVLMNLWLFRGKPPTDGKEVEIVVRSFKFSDGGEDSRKSAKTLTN